MAFRPESAIWLCNVPFDNSYKHVVRFTSRKAQEAYFDEKVVKTFSDYYTVRKTLPDGGVRSSVKVDMNIDAIRSLPCNYMFYQNPHHGLRIFYAFITEVIYINEETTELVFETDVYQTWMLDCEMKPCYVVREHSDTDEIGDNIVPESFNFEDYTYTNLGMESELTQWGYLIVASEPLFDTGSRGTIYSGVYQGLYFYYGSTASQVNEMLDSLEEDVGGECVVSITLIPRFCLKENTIGESTSKGATSSSHGQVFLSQNPAMTYHYINMGAYATTFDGYVPINNKLHTSPFEKLIVTNNAGEEAEYTIEDFSNRDNITFTIFGDVSSTPSVTMIPNNYKGVTNPVDYGISLGSFPQCGFNSDTYKLWMNKNFVPLVANNAMNMAESVLSPVNALTGGLTGGMGVAKGIISTLTSVYSASKEPNKSHLGVPKNNLLTAMGQNTFCFRIRHIKRCYAETIDNYFTMFGYQTNKVKMPNLTGRPFFNYVQTIDATIVGGIPNDDMRKLKDMFNAGVTLWSPYADIGDYSVDNSPT